MAGKRIIQIVIYLTVAVVLHGQQLKFPASGIPPAWHTGTLSFLSSGWMEGREAGERGAAMASDFIASLMESYRLEPYGDLQMKDPLGTPGKNFRRSWYQNFEMVRYKVKRSGITLKSQRNGTLTGETFAPDVDYSIEAIPNSLSFQAPVVFAGYGINAPAEGYDDYRNLDVNGCVVLVMKGFPGWQDTTSQGWKRFGKQFGGVFGESDSKLKTARKAGAVAVIELLPAELQGSDGNNYDNQPFSHQLMNGVKDRDPDYHDDFLHALPVDRKERQIPWISMKSELLEGYLARESVSLPGFEKGIAETMTASGIMLKGITLLIDLEVVVELVPVRNVLAVIPGTDTTRSVVIGAHYDHLGIREGFTYNGADDNASGVAGMLALARFWKELAVQPPVNLVFAAWTAEEKGLIGSRYYTDQRRVNSNNTDLLINFDMISRSAPEDTGCRVLSVGTKKESDTLRKIVSEYNQNLSGSFELDLWECSENGGSDYAPFAGKGVEVMTFFSGFHSDYHTPKDISVKSDPGKMNRIVNFANAILIKILSQKKEIR